MHGGYLPLRAKVGCDINSPSTNTIRGIANKASNVYAKFNRIAYLLLFVVFVKTKIQVKYFYISKNV